MRNFALRRLVHHLAIVSLLVCVALPPTAQAASWFERLKQSLSGDEGADAVLSTADLNSGLKEALRVGTQRVVGRLGQVDGFNLDPAIHISLPKELELVKDVLAQVGMGSALTDLEVRLNQRC